MKITNAYVDDPRKRGEYHDPYLVVEVDESLHETGDSHHNGTHNSNWRITPYGPFTAVDEHNIDWDNGDLGYFNTAQLHREPLVECKVLMPEEEMDLAMGLDRARRLLRKYADSWQFILDDLAAQRGRIIWRLQQHPLACVVCGRKANAEAYYRGTHLAYCPEHMAEHNRTVRHLRVNS